MPCQCKTMSCLISVVPPLFHILAHSITDMEVNVKKRKEKPPPPPSFTHTQVETKSNILFASLVSFLWCLNSKTGLRIFPGDFSDLTSELKFSCQSLFKYSYHYNFNHMKTILLTGYFDIICYKSPGIP